MVNFFLGFQDTDSRFRGNDSNHRFPNVSFMRKQESRRYKSITTMKYKEDIDKGAQEIHSEMGNPI